MKATVESVRKHYKKELGFARAIFIAERVELKARIAELEHQIRVLMGTVPDPRDSR